jgi:hypothetical protein
MQKTFNEPKWLGRIALTIVRHQRRASDATGQTTQSTRQCALRQIDPAVPVRVRASSLFCETRARWSR